MLNRRIGQKIHLRRLSLRRHPAIQQIIPVSLGYRRIGQVTVLWYKKIYCLLGGGCILFSVLFDFI